MDDIGVTTSVALSTKVRRCQLHNSHEKSLPGISVELLQLTLKVKDENFYVTFKTLKKSFLYGSRSSVFVFSQSNSNSVAAERDPLNE